VEHCGGTVKLSFGLVASVLDKPAEHLVGHRCFIDAERVNADLVDRGFTIGGVAFVEGIPHRENT
jgi:hypothetical protein